MESIMELIKKLTQTAEQTIKSLNEDRLELKRKVSELTAKLAGRSCINCKICNCKFPGTTPEWWHGPEEEPERGRMILIKAADMGSPKYFSTCHPGPGVAELITWEKWVVQKMGFGIAKWAYMEDLLRATGGPL